jgi:hypothetical protein
VPGSGAGSNLLNAFLLQNCNAASGALTPATALTSYGTLTPGGNDSGGFAEIRAFKAFKFQLVQIGATALVGGAVSIYGTTDPNAFQTYMYALQGRNPAGQSALPFGGNPNNLAQVGFLPGIPPSSWSLLDGLADQSGTGSSANPMTPAIPWFTGNGPIVALRAVITTAFTGGGQFSVSVIGIP